MGHFYLRNEFLLAATQLVLAMLGIGATLTVRDFKALMLSPRSMIVGTAVQMLLASSVVFVLLKMNVLNPAIVVGLILCSVAPGGSTSNVFTHIAKGNTTLSISITLFTSFVGLASIPFLLGLMIPEYVGQGFHVPTARLVTEMVLFLLTPLALGMVVLRGLPRQAPLISRLSVRLSLFVILVMIIGALNSGRMDLRVFGPKNIMTVVLFMAFHILLGLIIVRSFGVPREDIIAICMETAVRNGSLALLVKASLFPVGATRGPDFILFTVLLYTGMQSPIAILATYLGRRASGVVVAKQPAEIH